MSEHTQAPEAQLPAVPVSLSELNARTTRLDLITDLFKGLHAIAKADSDHAMLMGFKENGVKSATTAVDGKTAVTWTVREPQGKVKVGDEEALKDHVRDRHATEIEWLEVINPAFLKVLIARAKYDEATGEVVDKNTGEVIPGLTWVEPGEPTTVSPSWKADGRDRVFQELRDGSMAALLREALQLPAGTDAGTEGGQS